VPQATLITGAGRVSRVAALPCRTLAEVHPRSSEDGSSEVMSFVRAGCVAPQPACFPSEQSTGKTATAYGLAWGILTAPRSAHGMQVGRLHSASRPRRPPKLLQYTECNKRYHILSPLLLLASERLRRSMCLRYGVRDNAHLFNEMASRRPGLSRPPRHLTRLIRRRTMSTTYWAEASLRRLIGWAQRMVEPKEQSHRSVYRRRPNTAVEGKPSWRLGNEIPRTVLDVNGQSFWRIHSSTRYSRSHGDLWTMKSIRTWLFELLASSYHLPSPSTSPRHAAAHVSERYNDMLQGCLGLRQASLPGLHPQRHLASKHSRLPRLPRATSHQSEVSNPHSTASLLIHQLRESV